MTPEKLDQIESEVRHRSFSQDTRDLVAAIRQRDAEIAALKADIELRDAKIKALLAIAEQYDEGLDSGDYGHNCCTRTGGERWASKKDDWKARPHATDCQFGKAYAMPVTHL